MKMSELSKLPNVGKVLERLLIEVGIATPEQLREVGTENAFIRIRAKDPTACIRMLYGIQGAIEGVKDNLLSESKKRDLKKFHKSL